MRSLVALALLACTARVAAPVEPQIPAPQGWVTDTAGVIPDAIRTRIVALVDELREKTGAEIAVVTVRTTAPLDDFTYAMRIADAWKPGRRREDTGVVFLVATDDRKLRILVGYGLEGILPDGLVGEIEDREIVPAFRAGRVGDGVWRGVAALATRIAHARGVELSGAPAAGPAPVPAPGLPGWMLGAIVLGLLALMLYEATRPRGLRGRRYYSPFGWGGFGGWDGGGFGGGGGGFGGFGGGSSGGGGAGRSW